MITTKFSWNLRRQEAINNIAIYMKCICLLANVFTERGSVWSLWYSWRQVACADMGKADEWDRAASVLKMEEAAYSKSSAYIYRNTRRHFSQDTICVVTFRENSNLTPCPCSNLFLHIVTLFTNKSYSKLKKKRPGRCNWSIASYGSETWTCRSFATTVSQLKIYDFSGEALKGFEAL